MTKSEQLTILRVAQQRLDEQIEQISRRDDKVHEPVPREGGVACPACKSPLTKHYPPRCPSCRVRLRRKEGEA